jgi:GTPase Era involved in 16S rRNA processing
MTRLPAIPTFAIVGQPNEGKTTVMATLSEDDAAQISPVPGTTTHRRRYPVLVNGAEALVFWDTPGFENSGAVLEWLKQHDDLTANMPERFLAVPEHEQLYREECEILRTIAEGAAVIYVVDASRPVRPVDREQVEILRRCGNPRIGIVNSKSSQAPYLAEWHRLLATDFNHRHEFNAHNASFADRIELLEAIRAVIPEWKKSIDQTIAALKADWSQRLARLSDMLIAFLRELVTMSETETIQHGTDNTRASRDAQVRLRERIRRQEVEFRQRAREIFHHSRDHWDLGRLLEADLFSEEVWELLGLTKGQLVASGALVGAMVGGLVDLKLAGTSFLLGAVIGTASGAILAWMSADKATKFETPDLRLGPLKLPRRKLGGLKAAARVNPQSNLTFILLDRLLLYIQTVSSWSHGRRFTTPVEIEPADKIGPTTTWSREDRDVVSKYVALCLKSDTNKRDRAETALRALLIDKLRRLTNTP